jgi:hypothetical protein
MLYFSILQLKAIGWYGIMYILHRKLKSPGGKEMWELFRETGIEFTTSDKEMLTDIVNWKALRGSLF